MKLPDFLEFQPFNALRQQMGADALGDFVFFDPKKNLTGLERLSLEAEGLEVCDQSLTAAGDFTLVFKDSRVLVYPRSPQGPEEWRYHLADCEVIEALRARGELNLLQARTNLPQSQQGSYRVCPQCLQRLRYQNFDGVRQRHREYSQRIEAEFSLEAFFQRYPVYPVEVKEEAPIF